MESYTSSFLLAPFKTPSLLKHVKLKLDLFQIQGNQTDTVGVTEDIVLVWPIGVATANWLHAYLQIQVSNNTSRTSQTHIVYVLKFFKAGQKEHTYSESIHTPHFLHTLL